MDANYLGKPFFFFFEFGCAEVLERDIQLSASGHVSSRMKLLMSKGVCVHGPGAWASGVGPGSSNEELALCCSVFNHVTMILIDHWV